MNFHDSSIYKFHEISLTSTLTMFLHHLHLEIPIFAAKSGISMHSFASVNTKAVGPVFWTEFLKATIHLGVKNRSHQNRRPTILEEKTYLEKKNLQQEFDIKTTVPKRRFARFQNLMVQLQEENFRLSRAPCCQHWVYPPVYLP